MNRLDSKYDGPRVAQTSASAEIYADTVDLIKELAKNPIVEIVIGVALIEKMQKQGIIGELWGTALQGGLVGIVTAQQIAPLMPYLGQAGANLLGGVSKLLPAIAAAA